MRKSWREKADFASCGKLPKQLEVGHGSAHLYNIRKIKKSGLDVFLAGPRKWRAK